MRSTEYVVRTGTIPVADDIPPVEFRVVYDNDPINPRTEFDHLGTILHWHPNYNLGERVEMSMVEQIMEQAERDGWLWLPIYMYDHSGVTIQTTPFRCPWDSGQVGIICCTVAQANAHWQGAGNWTLDQVMECFRAEIDEFDKYLRGEVYGFIVEWNGETLDSCWGFIGDEEDVWAEAKASADYHHGLLRSLLRAPGAEEGLRKALALGWGKTFADWLDEYNVR